MKVDYEDKETETVKTQHIVISTTKWQQQVFHCTIHTHCS